ncbi:Fe-S cluster assembly scaffold protein NifU [Patescibacteria group bacterium]|nr:Fe-S cluster assembly scaffold protein NifU [Patescibacteria group bacterium]
MTNTYSQKVIDHFRDPHNMGSIDDPDGVGEVGNLACGDLMKLYIKVKDDKISEIKFETMGCAAAIATSSMITDIAQGKTLKEAAKITNQVIADELDGLPQIKMHCSNLAAEALQKAIKDYKQKK